MITVVRRTFTPYSSGGDSRAPEHPRSSAGGRGVCRGEERRRTAYAEREAGFLEQVVTPLMKQRNPKARQQALDTLMRGRTSFVIAQRITTVLNADMILVLDKGRIVASGTHHELMEDSAIYAEIYNSQLVGDAEVKTS